MCEPGDYKKQNGSIDVLFGNVEVSVRSNQKSCKVLPLGSINETEGK